MLGKINIAGLLLGATLFFVFSLNGIGAANSFPFRAVNVGDRLPVLTVKEIGSQEDVDLARFAGKPLLLVFFGADLPAKKERAVQALKAVHDLDSFAATLGLVTVVVNAQGDPGEVITEVATAAGMVGNVYADIDRQVYGSLGIFVMPSVLLVASDGTIAAGLGYSHDLAKRLKGEIEVMIGAKTRAQIDEELHPVMNEKSAEEKGAKRHFNLGMTMLERGQPESAMREFKKAVAIEPGLGKAYVHLGCLQLDDGQTEEAKASLAKGLELEPDLTPGLICQARIKAGEGDLAGAIDDLGLMMMRNSRNANLHYVLGGMLEVQGDQPGALKEYRQAYELLEKQSRAK